MNGKDKNKRNKYPYQYKKLSLRRFLSVRKPAFLLVRLPTNHQNRPGLSRPLPILIPDNIRWWNFLFALAISLIIYFPSILLFFASPLTPPEVDYYTLIIGLVPIIVLCIIIPWVLYIPSFIQVFGEKFKGGSPLRRCDETGSWGLLSGIWGKWPLFMDKHLLNITPSTPKPKHLANWIWWLRVGFPFPYFKNWHDPRRWNPNGSIYDSYTRCAMNEQYKSEYSSRPFYDLGTLRWILQWLMPVWAGGALILVTALVSDLIAIITPKQLIAMILFWTIFSLVHTWWHIQSFKLQAEFNDEHFKRLPIALGAIGHETLLNRQLPHLSYRVFFSVFLAGVIGVVPLILSL